ncbi:MAG: hypothetical protein Alpg2KO_32970 [Alphaproteobacteria bacterium]
MPRSTSTQTKSTKRLLVLDVDSTLIDHFGVWARTVDLAVKGWAKSRKMDPALLKRRMRQQMHRSYYTSRGRDNPFFTLYNAPEHLIDRVPVLQPRQPGDGQIAQAVQDLREQATSFYPGVGKALAALKGKASAPAIGVLSDGTLHTVVHRLALSLKHLDESGELPDGITALDLIDHVSAQKDPKSRDFKPSDDPVLARYEVALMARSTALPIKLANPLHDPADPDSKAELETRKPHAAGFLKLCQRFGVSAEQAVMIGDNHHDGGLVRAVTHVATGGHPDHGKPCFVWQRHGAQLCDLSKQVNGTLGYHHYKIGLQHTEAALKTKGIVPAVTLPKGFTSFDRVLNRWDWRAPSPAVKPKSGPADKPATP